MRNSYEWIALSSGDCRNDRVSTPLISVLTGTDTDIVEASLKYDDADDDDSDDGDDDGFHTFIIYCFTFDWRDVTSSLKTHDRTNSDNVRRDSVTVDYKVKERNHSKLGHVQRATTDSWQLAWQTRASSD